MSFKLGVVGHKETFSLVQQIVHDYFNDIELFHVEFGTDDVVDDVVERIRLLMNNCDGMLYSRYDPYFLISSRLTHTIPVRYVAIDRSHLIASLLRGVIKYGISLTNISLDNFDLKNALEAFASVGVDTNTLKLRLITANINSPGFVRETLAQHIKNYEQGSELCVTNITSVFLELIEHGIPAVVINPSTESFIHEIRNLMLRHNLRVTAKTSIAVLAINIQYKERFQFYREMPLREIDEYASAAKLLNLFAEKNDGSVFSLSKSDYRIICHTSTLRSTTYDFTDISIMQGIVSDTAFEINIGIGLGKNVRESEINSLAALAQSKKQPGSNTHVMIDSQKILGPIVSQSYDLVPESGIDKKLISIAEITGISFHTIHHLYQNSHSRSVTLFTSADIAKVLNITPRSVNRIIGKLIDHGYATIVGRNIMSQKGRPSNMIKLLF
jgi:hypothetical protein